MTQSSTLQRLCMRRRHKPRGKSTQDIIRENDRIKLVRKAQDYPVESMAHALLLNLAK
jgi:hypothetical protein